MKQTRQRKKGKLYNRKAMAILFIGFLMLFCLVNVLVRDKEFSEKENRMLEQKPKLSWTGIESGRYMKQYESYKSDQFAGRNFWVAFKTRVDLIAGRRESNGVFKGDKKYLLEDIAKPNQEQMKQNLATYPDLDADIIARIVDVSGSNMNVEVKSMDAETGLLTFHAVSSAVIDIPGYVNKLTQTGLFSSVDYSGYQYQDGEYTLDLSCILKAIDAGGDK